MEKIRRIQLFEILLYALILVTVLSIPFFAGSFQRRGMEGVFFEWSRVIPFLLVFLVNNYWLAPRFLFREKYMHYMLYCIVLVTVMVILSDYLFDLFRMAPPFENLPGEESFIPGKGEIGPGNPPDFRSHGPPDHFRFRFNFGHAIVSFLLIGFNTGMKIFVKYTEDQIRQSEKERQHLFTELAFLRYQISPHFFMNTLNNIHALVDIDRERAKDAIVRLSKMMRYLLYESEPEKVSLKKEIEFIGSYIELMRLRYDETNLEIVFEYPRQTDEVFVPAFLFLSFIENAFKHGIHPTDRSFIRLAFVVNEKGHLQFSMKNSIGNRQESVREASGIGIENIKKRLDILYKDNYELKIQENPDEFEVLLLIPQA